MNEYAQTNMNCNKSGNRLDIEDTEFEIPTANYTYPLLHANRVENETIRNNILRDF